jgi:GNAT superfamily N-acetyltransferase
MMVRRAVPGDEPILRATRLRALADSPGAFGSTYSRELARTAADWQRWLSPGATFILTAGEGEQAQGIAAGMFDAVDPAVVLLMAMWVDPAMRGTGASDALVAAVLGWAREVGARALRLAVIEGNHRARRCYERNGFRATGNRSARERDGAIEVEMERLIHGGSAIPTMSNSARCGD